MKKVVIFGIIAIVLVVILTMLFSGGEHTVVYTYPSMTVADDLKNVRTHESEALSAYKVLDSVRGIYQIPIDSAIVKYFTENSR